MTALLLTACAPMLELREGPEAERLRALVQQFCTAKAAGDMAGVAAVFEPKLETALLAAGPDVKLASRASQSCQPGRVWYIGGSRRLIEIRQDGFSDRLDLWLSGQGRAKDLDFGDGGPTLRAQLGLR